VCLHVWNQVLTLVVSWGTALHSEMRLCLQRNARELEVCVCVINVAITKAPIVPLETRCEEDGLDSALFKSTLKFKVKASP